MRFVALAAVLVVAAAAGAVWLVLQPPAAREAAESGTSVVDQQKGDGETTRRRVRTTPRDRPQRARIDPLETALAHVRTAEHDGRFLDALEALLRLRAEHPDRFADGAHDAWLLALQRAVPEEVQSALGSLSREDAVALLEQALASITDMVARRRLRRLALGLADDVAGRERVVLSGAVTAAEREALATHLAHFGPTAPGTDRSAAATGRLATQLTRLRDRAATRAKPVEPLPVADHDAAEQRRIDQLEKLRQRGAVGLLDHIHSGLAWLALHQAPDGSFGDTAVTARCSELGHAASCVEKGSKGRYGLAASALATLAFLDFRDQDARARFEPTLSAAVSYLRSRIREDGAFPKHAYEAPIALMALGQAASSSGDPEVLADLERAWTFYGGPRAIGPAGGYRYSLRQAGDLSVTGWYVQALETALAAGADVPAGLRERLRDFVQTTWDGERSFTYQVSKQPRWSMQPVGMLSLSILAPEIAEQKHDDWSEHLRKTERSSQLNLYVLYYDVRMELALRGDLAPHRRTALDDFAALHQTAGGDAAGRFTAAPDKTVVKSWTRTNKRRPAVRGKDTWLSRGGTTVFTAFSILTLEHALYRR